LLLFRMPKMFDRCEKCNCRFQGETGFFIGAMYVSYGLSVAETIVLFLMAWFVFDIPLMYIYIGVILMLVVNSTFNFRMSRIIWIYLFHGK